MLLYREEPPASDPRGVGRAADRPCPARFPPPRDVAPGLDRTKVESSPGIQAIALALVSREHEVRVLFAWTPGRSVLSDGCKDPSGFAQPLPHAIDSDVEAPTRNLVSRCAARTTWSVHVADTGGIARRGTSAVPAVRHHKAPAGGGLSSRRTCGGMAGGLVDGTRPVCRLHSPCSACARMTFRMR